MPASDLSFSEFQDLVEDHFDDRVIRNGHKAVSQGQLGSLEFTAVDDEDFESEVETLAGRLAALPTRALGMTKTAFNEGWDRPLTDHLTRERDLQIAAAATADYAEGVAAFLEKRTPEFTGK